MKSFRLSNKPIKTNILLKSDTIILSPLKKIVFAESGLGFPIHPCPIRVVFNPKSNIVRFMSRSLFYAVSRCPTRVPCCEGREGHWGYDHRDDHCHMLGNDLSKQRRSTNQSLLEFRKNVLIISSRPLFFISALYSFSPNVPSLNEGLSVKFKAFGHTFNIPWRKYNCKDSFSLTTCSHLRWSLRPSLPANLPPALCPSVHRLLRRDLCGWPVEPQGPLSLAQRWPPEEAQHRGERASSRWTKGECNVLAPHESSQAHREHIRTSGFYLPFLLFFCSCKESTGRQVRQVLQERHAPGPKEPHVCVLPIHVVGFHVLRPPLKRYGKWRFFFGRSCQHQRRPSHLNAASRGRLKLKGRPSMLNPRITGLLKTGYIRAGESGNN